LPWKITVRSGACAIRRTRPQGALLTVICARRHDARREEDGPAALAGAVTRVRDGGDRQASSGGSATPSTPVSTPTPAELPAHRLRRAREGSRGTTLTPARPAHTPNASSSDKPLPDPAPPYDPPARAGEPRRRSRLPRKPAGRLDSSNKEDSIWASLAVGTRAVHPAPNRCSVAAVRQHVLCVCRQLMLHGVRFWLCGPGFVSGCAAKALPGRARGVALMPKGLPRATIGW
jgi:hypothetical protein